MVHRLFIFPAPTNFTLLLSINGYMQNLESDLAVRVTSLHERRLALSMENNTLKQQVVRLQKERFNVEGKLFIFLLIVFTCY